MTKHNHLMNEAIEDSNTTGLNIKDQGYSSDYVGVNIKQIGKNMISLSLLALIDSVKDVGMKPCIRIKPVPCHHSKSCIILMNLKLLMVISIC